MEFQQFGTKFIGLQAMGPSGQKNGSFEPINGMVWFDFR
jgi:hypothetical protein